MPKPTIHHRMTQRLCSGSAFEIASSSKEVRLCNDCSYQMERCVAASVNECLFQHRTAPACLDHLATRRTRTIALPNEGPHEPLSSCWASIPENYTNRRQAIRYDAVSTSTSKPSHPSTDQRRAEWIGFFEMPTELQARSPRPLRPKSGPRRLGKSRGLSNFHIRISDLATAPNS